MAEAEDDLEQGGSPGPRPFWSGTITFGLVSIPVALYPASRPRRAGLRMVTADGIPLERKYVSSETGRELDWDDIVRGYEIEKGKFVVVTDEELEAVEPRKSRDIDLRLFVDAGELDPRYFDRGYFLTPAGGSNKAYRLLAAVMEKTGKAGLATFIMRTKEYVIAILAENGILRAETLRFADEVRSPEDVGLPKKKKAGASEVGKLEKAIKAKSKKVDFSEFLDDSIERLEQIARRKKKQKKAVVHREEEAGSGEGAEVIDLLEVLSRSLGSAGERRPAKQSPRKTEAGLSSLSKDELYDRAKKKDIPGRSSMTKTELIRVLEG
ncbi:MAG: Ku protein [Thermoanaerobaculia bacterium]